MILVYNSVNEPNMTLKLLNNIPFSSFYVQESESESPDVDMLVLKALFNACGEWQFMSKESIETYSMNQVINITR